MRYTFLNLLLIILFWNIIGCSVQKETSLNLSSFNLRLDTESDGENAWPNRKEMVKGVIRFYELDIIGTQEGFKHQLEDILELGDYVYVGGGRDDGVDAGEHSAIIYNKNRFEVVDKGDFWFSETPGVPSKGWDATCCNRICSWAKFRERKSGKEFFLFNAHYDHEGKEARRNSSLLLLDNIKKIAGNNPVVVTGDFNATPDSEPIQIIYDSGLLNDAYLVTQAPPYGTAGTFNSFQPDAPMKNRIDYIWVTPDVQVIKYGTLNDMQYGRFPSDHFPVMIKAKL
jgi:endonuclease/exonuclease/phosphatase family metal-dependent hydrolase